MLNEERMVLELSNCEICDIRMAITGVKADMEQEYRSEDTKASRKEVLVGSMEKWDRLYNKIVKQHKQQIDSYEQTGKINKTYAALEPDNKLYQLIKCMDARWRITLWKLDNYSESIVDDSTNPVKVPDVNYVYELFDKKHQDIMDNYVIDYIRFDFDGLVVAIKPEKWSILNK